MLQLTCRIEVEKYANSMRIKFAIRFTERRYNSAKQVIDESLREKADTCRKISRYVNYLRSGSKSLVIQLTDN